MPIYAFKCEACGHAFDRLQKLSDSDPVECQVCGQPRLRRQVTAPSFRLSGSGWYETDFKSDKNKQRNLAGKDEAPAPPAADKADKAAPTTDKPADKSSKPVADSTPPARPSTPASPPSEQ